MDSLDYLNHLEDYLIERFDWCRYKKNNIVVEELSVKIIKMEVQGRIIVIIVNSIKQHSWVNRKDMDRIDWWVMEMIKVYNK